MEVALEVKYPRVPKQLRGRFNPCFRGSSSGRSVILRYLYAVAGFNPCFRGSSSGRRDSIPG